MPGADRPRHRLLGLAAGLWLAQAAGAGDLFVVCNPEVVLAREDVRDVFLGDKRFAGAIKLNVVDNAAAQDEFLERVLAMIRSKYSKVWMKKSFREGINPPQLLASDAEVIAFVRRTSGGCGYVRTEPDRALAVVTRY